MTPYLDNQEQYPGKPQAFSDAQILLLPPELSPAAKFVSVRSAPSRRTGIPEVLPSVRVFELEFSIWSCHFHYLTSTGTLLNCIKILL